MKRQYFRLCTFALALILAAMCAAYAAAVRPVLGPVILAKPGPISEFIWDATPYVAQLVDDRTLGDDGLRAVEATAIAALVEKASASNAKVLKVNVVYKMPSATSIYGSPTFSDQQPLLNVALERDDAARRGASWAQSTADGKTPSDVKISVTGKLPPAQ